MRAEERELKEVVDWLIRCLRVVRANPESLPDFLETAAKYHRELLQAICMSAHEEFKEVVEPLAELILMDYGGSGDKGDRGGS